MFRTRGQTPARAAIERAIREARPPHALILTGPVGVGKTTLALDLAAGLLCLSEVLEERPCWECASCRKVDHGNHPDLHRLAPDGAGDQIRLGAVQALIADLALLPMEGRVRVAIVEAADRLNPDAQNALLKTLEEPPPGVSIVLCVDDQSLLLSTVTSRATRIGLGPVKVSAIAELLEERGTADAARARVLATLAGGRPGIALTLSLDPESTIVHGRLARSLIDLLAQSPHERLAAVPQLLDDAATFDRHIRGETLLDGGGGSSEEAGQGADEPPKRATRSGGAGARRSPAATKASRRPSPVERRRAVRRLLDVWRAMARDLAVAARGGQRELVHLELIDELVSHADGIDDAQLVRFLDRLDRLSIAIDAYANPELVLDVLLLSWPRRSMAA